ncbi:hypothetical protein MMC14_001598 [Varicellaria rhodocarpa]|nr:hypothetical protein [Varicellaria rhodocarpa]
MASSSSIPKVFASAVSSIFTKKKDTYRRGKLVCRNSESMYLFHEDDSDGSNGGSDFLSQSVLYDQISCRKGLSETEYVESDDTMDTDVLSIKETMFDNDAGVEFNDNQCSSREDEPVGEVIFESNLPETGRDNNLDVDLDEGTLSDEIPFREGLIDLNWQDIFDENVFELSGSDADDDGKNVDEGLSHDKYTTTKRAIQAQTCDKDASYNPWADLADASSFDDNDDKKLDTKNNGYRQDLSEDPEDPIPISEEEWMHISHVQENLTIAERDVDDSNVWTEPSDATDSDYEDVSNAWAERSDDSESDPDCDSMGKDDSEEYLAFSAEEMSNLMHNMDASYISLSSSEENDHNNLTLTFHSDPIQIPIPDPKWIIEWHSPRQRLLRESLGRHHLDYVKTEEVEGIKSRAEAYGMVCAAETTPDLWSGDEIAFMRVGYC